MSKTRGRALIISNRDRRTGSDHDNDNIKRMLGKFGFITVGGHDSYTAQVMNLPHSTAKSRYIQYMTINVSIETITVERN